MLAVRAFLKSLSKAHVVSGIACSPGAVDSQVVIGVMPGILKISQIDISEAVGVTIDFQYRIRSILFVIESMSIAAAALSTLSRYLE